MTGVFVAVIGTARDLAASALASFRTLEQPRFSPLVRIRMVIRPDSDLGDSGRLTDFERSANESGGAR